METQTYTVSGMHCASCAGIITKKLKKLQGVASCDVNFATEKATVSFNPNMVSVDHMNHEIDKLGYTLKNPHTMEDHSMHTGVNQTKEEKLKELGKLKTKIHFVLPFTFIVFILMMWDILAKFSVLSEIPVQASILNTFYFILASVVLFWVGNPYLTAILRFIRYRVANMDALVGIGTVTAYLYSSLLFLFPALEKLLNLPQNMYFDVTIVVIGFITLGKYLESASKLKTGQAIEKLLGLQAKKAVVVRDGNEIEIPISEVAVGDLIRVKPGEKVPVDGVITQGSSSIDESMINGEPIPVDKKTGDLVIGSTINKQGSFLFQAAKVGKDTVLSQIIRMVEESQGSKAQIQNLADKVSAVFIPAVLVIAVLAFILWVSVGSYFLGFSQALSFALLSFVGILVIACPCALGLATPTAIIVGVGKGAEHGILIKNAQSLEKLHQVNTVVMDKTGTITTGKPVVTDVLSLDGSYDDKKILQLAGSLEKHSGHPVAVAIVEKGKQEAVDFLEAGSFKEQEGLGVSGEIHGKKVEITKPKEHHEYEKLSLLQEEGKTVVVVELDSKPVGLIAISDTVKESAKLAIQRLHKLKIKTVMLTGDNKKAAAHIAHQVGIDTVKAEVLPQDKSAIIKDLQKEGAVVAMVGDGINDAPALTRADVGIAMATGTDIAIESADITLLGGELTKVPQAILLSRYTIRTIKQNLFWAFIYNVIGIPVAGGLLFPFFGIFLSPIFAGLAMALSSVSVVSNSLMLKRAKL